MTDPIHGLPKGADYADRDPTRQGWSGNGLRAQGTGQTAYDVAEYRARDGIDGGRFASVVYGAWHEIGKVAPAGTSAEELLRLAGGDYEVYLVPSMAPIYDALGQITGYTEDPTRMQICRRNPATGAQEILGNRTVKYGLWQHTEMFCEFGDALLDVSEPCVSTSGILYGGRQAFMCWQLPDEISVDGVDDTIQLWLLAHTSHDGSTPATLAVTPLRTVCGNTSRWNLRNALYKVSIRHTANRENYHELKLQEVREALHLVQGYAGELEAEAKALRDAYMSTAKFEEIVQDLWGPSEDASKGALTKWDRTMGHLLDIWGTDDKQATCRNTAWAAVNTIGQFADWDLKFKDQKALWEGTEAGGKFWRSLSGNRDVESKKTAIMRVVAEYAGV